MSKEQFNFQFVTIKAPYLDDAVHRLRIQQGDLDGVVRQVASAAEQPSLEHEPVVRGPAAGSLLPVADNKLI